MKNVSKIVVGSLLVCLVFSIAFTSVSTAAITLPTYSPGDFFKYFYVISNVNKTAGTNQYENITMYDNVTSVTSKTINNQTYNVYDIESFGNGSGIYKSSMYTFTVTIQMNVSTYVNINDLSKLWEMNTQNMTIGAYGYQWTQTTDTYTVPEDSYHYPISLGTSWYDNSTYNETSHTIRSFPTRTDTWSNSTNNSNNYFDTVIDDEPVASYDCYKVNETDLNSLSSPPTQRWISQAAGSQEVMQIQEKYISNETDFSYRILIDGSFNGASLPPVPIPQPKPSIFEFSALMLPIAGIIALFIVVVRKR